MDPRTLELLRLLQADQHDAGTLDSIREQFREQRKELAAKDDRATLDELCELLEAWAEGATGDLASAALHEAALSIEEDLEQPERAIAVLERVLDLEPTTDSLAQLARLYAQRNREGDKGQAAELYSALGETLGDEGRPWLERALNLMPAHESAMTALEALVPEAERGVVLRDRWIAYLEAGAEASAEAGSDTAQAAERRRLELSRAYAAEGSYRDALVFISPLAERGHAEAARLHEAYLANLEGAVAPTKRGRKADSLPPPKHARPARSGGTMVGFRLDQYHEALRKEQAGDESEDESSPAASDTTPEPIAPVAAAAAAAAPAKPSMMKTQLGLGAMNIPEPAKAPAPIAASAAKAAPAPIAAPAPVAAKAPETKPMMKTQLGIGIPSSLTASQPKPAPASEPPAAEAPSEDSVVRAMPRAKDEAASAANTSSGSTDAPADEQAAPTRKSLPPPNPAVVRASQPAARRSSSGAQAVAATLAASPSLQRHLSPVPASASVAPAPAAQAFPMPGSLPAAGTEVALPQPSFALPAFAAPAVAAEAAPSLDHFAESKAKPRALWPFAVGGVLVIALGAGAMLMKGNKTETTASSAPVEAPPAPTTAAPPPSAATTTAATTAPAAAGALPTTAQAATAPTPAEAAAAVEPAKPATPPKPEPVKGNVKALAKEIKVKGGKITSASILSAIDDSLTQISHCYEEVLEDSPKVAGKATLTFSIMKTGKIATPKVAKSTLKSAKLEKCTLEALKGEKFSKVKKVAKVTLPLSFTR